MTTRADTIDVALDALITAGDVATETTKPTRGRPTTRYFWVAGARDSLSALLSGEPT